MNTTGPSAQSLHHPHLVIGAGPAGLVAAASIARAGGSVHVVDRGAEVGHRFSGDFQGLENWSTSQDVLEWLRVLGVEPDFEFHPFHEVTFYDHRLDATVARGGSGPLFYLIRRGPMDGSLDRALLDQARAAGATVEFGTLSRQARRGEVVAKGPRYADGLVTGFVFSTSLENQARCIISDRLAPAGYAYLLSWNGRATLATCLFRRHHDWRTVRNETVDAFCRLVPGLRAELDDDRPFSGYGSVFPAPRYTDEGGRLYIGEAAGIQDPEWGFGLRFAIESGALAAQSLLDGLHYRALASAAFERRIRTQFANRMLFEALPEAAVRALLRRGAASNDLRRRLHRHWKPTRTKSLLARATRRRFSKTRLAHRDLACHLASCDCLWCSHRQDHASSIDDPAAGTDDDRS